MSSPNFSQQPSAFYAGPQIVNDPSLYMGFGVSYYVSPNANQFDQFTSTGFLLVLEKKQILLLEILHYSSRI